MQNTHLPAALCVALAGALGAQQPLDTVRTTAASRVASLGAIQHSVDIIERSQIERRPARSVTDLLAMTLGADVQWRSPAQADLTMRGGSLGQVLVLVDGVRQSDLQTAHFDLDLAVPLAAVERIEVIRGASSALYGADAVGGIVNIVTRREGGWNAASAHGGSFGTAGAAFDAATSLGGTSLRLDADGERSDGHRPGTDYRMGQLRLGAGHAVPGGTLSLDAGAASRDFGAADFYAPALSYERTRTGEGSLRWFSNAAGAWSGTAVASLRRHTDDFILRRTDPSFYRNRHVNWQSSLEASVRRAVAEDAGLVLGTELFDAQLASARLGNRREQRAALFTEAALGTARAASVTLGARGDWSSILGAFFSPSLASSVAIGDRRWLRGSIARGFRAPSWTDRYYRDPANIGNPSLVPERFWTGEVGLRALPGWGRLDVAAWTRRADDLIDWARASSTDPWRTMNVSHATYDGLEASVGVAGVAGAQWDLYASALRFSAASSTGLQGKYALRPLTRVAGGSVTRALFTPSLRGTLDVRNARRAGETAWTQVNARLRLDTRDVAFTLDLTNVGNTGYLDASGRPVAKRAAFAGVRWGR